HRLQLLCVAFHGQHDRPLLYAVAAGGNRGNDLARVGQAEADGERAVRTKLNRLPLQGHVSAGLGRSINDQLRIDLKMEVAAQAGKSSDGEILHRDAREGATESLLKQVTKVKGRIGPSASDRGGVRNPVKLVLNIRPVLVEGIGDAGLGSGDDVRPRQDVE